MITHKINISHICASYNKADECKEIETLLSKDLCLYSNDRYGFTIATKYHQAVGLGERYHKVNHKGETVVNCVEEQFCMQGEKTYFPLPFFMLDTGYGFFVATKEVLTFTFEDNIQISSKNPIDGTLYIFKGTYKEIIKNFIEITGVQKKAPKWIFGPWISAHRWNSQKMVEDVMEKLKVHHIPVTVMVLEQWSDEATFYIFNGATYPDKKVLVYEDYDYTKSPWKNPKAMVEQLHENGIKLLLWQCPVVKEIPEDEPFNERHYKESMKAIQKEFVVKGEKNAYRIPDGHWFSGSMIPDFTNPATYDWWFANRQYLLDIGIDGFKTDGGEFIYDKASNYIGETEAALKNNYSLEYGKAYGKFLGEDKVAFSRAGYIGQQSHTLMWAGDQKSTFKELQAIYRAGIQASLCGQINWGFDIAGFSGELPSAALYYRATQLAVFTPIMQVHSEPVGGQFSITDPTRVFNNERTPWNMAYSSEVNLEEIAKLYRLRMNLLPYIYSEYLKAIEKKSTLMKHVNIDYIGEFDENMFLFGDLIILPVLEEECFLKEVKFPSGEYYNILTNKKVMGRVSLKIKNINDLYAFIPSGTAIVSHCKNLYPEKIDNSLEKSTLYFRLYGDIGEYTYKDKEQEIIVKWEKNEVKVIGAVQEKLEFIFIE